MDKCKERFPDNIRLKICEECGGTLWYWKGCKHPDSLDRQTQVSIVSHMIKPQENH